MYTTSIIFRIFRECSAETIDLFLKPITINGKAGIHENNVKSAVIFIPILSLRIVASTNPIKSNIRKAIIQDEFLY